MTDQLSVEQLKTGIRMTADIYFSLPETNQPIQLLNGALIVSPPPIPWHQLIVGNSYQLLLSLIPNGKIFLSPIALHLDAENVPEPDLVWVAANSRCVMAEKRLEGPPELIIEVLSPGTARYDKTEKFLLYERFGVPEYWLADPTTKQLEVWVLEAGKYTRLGMFGIDESFESPILGAVVQVGRVFEV